MNLSIGIVGLPNVGKSTLFNALTKQQVLAANYPFATIDPNHGIVPVVDERLSKLAVVEKSGKIVYAAVEFVDIAGLVKGASTGAGLGNKFLGNIKQVSAIVHLVRAFNNSNITHVENSIDPSRDIGLINTELIIKDIETVMQRIKQLESKAKLDKKLQPSIDYMKGLLAHLEAEKPAREFEHVKDELPEQNRFELYLITDKPVIYLVNTEDDRKQESVNLVKSIVGENEEVFGLDVKQEYELASMEDSERVEFMNDLGIDKTGLESLSLLAYKSLGLISYFTAGPMEARAWTIRSGMNAQEAAGEIHTDIMKNFIAADVCNWEDFVTLGGWVGAKEKGKVALQGKTYIVKDGDVMLFKHNG